MQTSLEQPRLSFVTHAAIRNLRELGTLWGRAIGGEFHQEPEATWFVSRLPFMLYNWVTQTRFTESTSTEKIDALLTRWRSYQHALLWVDHASQPDNLLTYMQTHGWGNGSFPIWARELQKVEEPLTPPEGVTVELVDRTALLEQWIKVFASGYDGTPGYVFEHAMTLLRRYGFVDHPAVSYYLGRLNGEPVTCSLLFLAGGVAGIYNTATLPLARRQGVATAVTRAALQRAGGLGYHLATLQATPMSVALYRQLGFQTGGSINFYVVPGLPPA